MISQCAVMSDKHHEIAQRYSHSEDKTGQCPVWTKPYRALYSHIYHSLPTATPFLPRKIQGRSTKPSWPQRSRRFLSFRSGRKLPQRMFSEVSAAHLCRERGDKAIRLPPHPSALRLTASPRGEGDRAKRGRMRWGQAHTFVQSSCSAEYAPKPPPFDRFVPGSGINTCRRPCRPGLPPRPWLRPPWDRACRPRGTRWSGRRKRWKPRSQARCG